MTQQTMQQRSGARPPAPNGGAAIKGPQSAALTQLASKLNGAKTAQRAAMEEELTQRAPMEEELTQHAPINKKPM